MGPIRLDEWGPPMEEVVYALFSRDKDKFSLIFVDECVKSNDVGFFTKNSQFKCWMNHAGSEKNLYLAIRPMFKESTQSRHYVVDKIISKYNPPCNVGFDRHISTASKTTTSDDTSSSIDTQTKKNHFALCRSK